MKKNETKRKEKVETKEQVGSAAKKEEGIVYKEGIFCGNEKGFGFVTTEDSEQDYFIPEKFTLHAFHGDTVKIRLLPESRGQRPEAKVVEILSHAVKTVVGTYEKSEGYGFIVCDSKKIPWDIYIRREYSMGARDGQKCVAELTSYGSERMSPEGKIVEILGDKDAPGVDILSLVKSYDVPETFPEEVLDEAEALPEKIGKKDLKGRADLRDVRTVTIDGDDSKDFDDAVSIEKDGSDYILAVHIADVSHYVTEDSSLDIEARKRGTSVYLCDRVIPMLPHRLSDNLCSIVEGKDRLALSVIMRFDRNGKEKQYRITESVIRSDHRMTYNNVNRILEDKDKAVRKKYADMVPDFELMEKLAAKLFKRRVQRGSIEFDLPEAEIILNEDGHAVDVRLSHRGVSQKMIEEFMLAANETVALHFCREKIPFVYRVHDVPDAERIHKLKTLIEKFGYTINVPDSEVTPVEISKLLAKIEGKDEEDFITTISLRSMQRAVYSTENRGHFGLAAKYYCHFTSPIRRYPDLQIHRIIHETLAGKMTAKRKNHYISLLDAVADHSSDMERRSTELERDVDKLKMTEFMADHVGESFDGKVSGVVRWGIYVELPNTVEGLVSVHTMRDDTYEFDEDAMELVGKFKNRHFTFGTPVHVKLVSADVVNRTLDFVLDEPGQEGDGEAESGDRKTSGGRHSGRHGGRHAGKQNSKRSGEQAGKQNSKRSEKQDKKQTDASAEAPVDNRTGKRAGKAFFMKAGFGKRKGGGRNGSKGRKSPHRKQ